ncbi:MAG: type II CAAX prenyl endopeptidase Rce1 family protein, partial [Candidatus Hodarchaeota archaeon]
MNIKIKSEWKGDEIFEYFARDITNKKKTLILILFPLGAFVEEFLYRCLFLSVLIYSFKWNLLFSIFFISGLFGIVHYSASKNVGHVLSTLISSLIYFYALINLGLLYPWLFHFLTNLLVVLFYVQNR